MINLSNKDSIQIFCLMKPPCAGRAERKTDVIKPQMSTPANQGARDVMKMPARSEKQWCTALHGGEKTHNLKVNSGNTAVLLLSHLLLSYAEIL